MNTAETSAKSASTSARSCYWPGDKCCSFL